MKEKTNDNMKYLEGNLNKQKQLNRNSTAKNQLTTGNLRNHAIGEIRNFRVQFS